MRKLIWAARHLIRSCRRTAAEGGGMVVRPWCYARVEPDGQVLVRAGHDPVGMAFHGQFGDHPDEIAGLAEYFRWAWAE